MILILQKRHHAGMWQLVMSNAIGIGMVCHYNTVSPCVSLTLHENLRGCMLGYVGSCSGCSATDCRRSMRCALMVRRAKRYVTGDLSFIRIDKVVGNVNGLRCF